MCTTRVNFALYLVYQHTTGIAAIIAIHQTDTARGITCPAASVCKMMGEPSAPPGST
jgi:hypothetical protein